ncbi:MAG: DUF4124 domain-containing protein [Betaproteobacteria bacterium]
MMRLLFAFLVCLVLPLEAWGQIYRWVDEQGRTVYSDIPKPGAERVELPPLPAFSPPAQSKPAEKPAEPAARAYTVLAIDQPDNEETIHDNNGMLGVALTLAPPLQTGRDHRIRIFLDGEALPDTQTSTHFSLTEINRGGHTLQAAVVDRSGQPLITSAPVTFYMWRASAKFSPH